jgi:hypothetical protein
MILYNNLLIYNSLTKGKGIITMKKIKKGSFIMWYEGDFISNNTSHETAIDGRYDYETINGFITVDEPFHKSHYVNDCLSDNNFEKSKNGLNVICMTKKRLTKGNKIWPCYIATRDIEIGEPLETFYGSSYWLYHEPTLFCENVLCQIEKYSLLKTIELLRI